MHVIIGPTTICAKSLISSPYCLVNSQSLDDYAGTPYERIGIVDSRAITPPSSFFLSIVESPICLHPVKKCCHPHLYNAYAPSSFNIDTQRPDNRSFLPRERISPCRFCCLDMTKILTKLWEMAVSLHDVLPPSVAEQQLIDIPIHQSPQIHGNSRKAVQPQPDETRLLRRYTFSKDW